MTVNYEFGSDNHSGVHPDIMKEINSINKDYFVAYGEDEYTKSNIGKMKKHFGKNIDIYFVGNGTAANILGLKAVTKSFNSIICAEKAHLNVHECCGPEKFLGCKLVTIPTKDAKLDIDLLKKYIVGFGDTHMAQPKIVSITQASECGTVYTPEEIKNISDFAHENNMLLHMDGARLCNAAAYLDEKISSITSDVGIDILSFGGTKNGMMFGDAVIFFNKDLSKDFEFYRKQGMHLTSKMRFISAQFNAFFSNKLWLKNAKHANDMAQLLFKKIKGLSNLEVVYKVQSNAVFVKYNKKHNSKLLKKYFFHIFDEKDNIVRWMCSYNTAKSDVIDFSETVKEIIR